MTTQQLHVLIIEDEPFVAMFIEDALRGAGAGTFSFACTQEEAVAAAQERRPDFITADVNLLSGTGPAAVEAIHQGAGDIPVLFITATPDACRPCAPPGDVISKPASGTDIAHRFRTSMDDPRLR